MSLQTAAEAVRQKGRGEDTMLIHMTPGEVNGLQQLAMAYGGSLTTNPETGLPEAGFLKSLLPTLIGAGLVIGTGGAVTPLMAGLGVGAVETLRTGDLGRGLMAGLGAYGGGGLGSAATAAGRQAGTMAASEAGRQAGTMAATQTPSGLAGVSGYGSTTATNAFSPMATQTAPSALQGAMQAGSSSAVSGLATPIGAATYTPATTVAGRFAEAGAGLGNIVGASGTAATQEAARTAGMASLGGGMGAAKTVGAALIEPLTAVPEAPTVAQPEYNYDGPYVPSERKVRFPTDRDPADSSEFQYFDVVNPAPGFEPMAARASLPPIDPNEGTFAGIPVSLATNPDLMRQYQQAGYYAEGGEVTAPPEGYRAGMDAEFDYGFRPMAAQVPEIQQQAAQENALVQARLGNDGGGSDYYGPGVPFNQVNNPLPQEVRSNLVDRITDMNRAQQQRAAAAAAVAMGATPSEGGNWDPNETAGPDYGTMSGAGTYSGDVDRSEAYFRRGGELNMDNGGFVVDAHTVSEIGNGSSDAGHEMLARIGGEPIKGPGDGVSDSISANIGGVQEARVAKDESYLSRSDVKALGGGDLKKGEKMLYKLMEKAHKSRKQKGRGQATGLDKLIARMA